MIIETIIYSIAGGCLYRWRGMAHPMKRYFPRPLNQIAFALPYAAVCIPPNTNSWVIPAVVLVITTLAVLSGHGQYFLPASKKQISPETLDIALLPFFSDDPRGIDVK